MPRSTNPVRVLLFAADPYPNMRLLLDKEIRQIKDAVRMAEYRDELEIDDHWATRPRDLLPALNATHPQVVHFSGHCGSGGLVLVGENGEEHKVSHPALERIFATFRRDIRLVVLNACFSLPQARAIAHVVGCAIGTPDKITDAAATTFSASFYGAIAAGCSVQDAYDQACAALEVDYHDPSEFPELVARDDVDPSQLVLVRADDADGRQMPEAASNRLSAAAGRLLRHTADRLVPRLHRRLTELGTLEQPPELTDLDEYLLGLRTRLEHELHTRTYVPLRARRLAPNGTALVEEARGKDPFIRPFSQAILQIMGRAQGGDNASAQIAVLNRRSKPVRNILRLLEHPDEPLVLLGEPGSGKTLTLQQATLALAAVGGQRVYPRIPAYVRLGEFHVHGRKPNPADVREYVLRSLPDSLRRWAGELERGGRMVVFFDGMDEMSRERYGEHTEALSLYAGRGLPTLFSCRITDFSPKFIHQKLVILPFGRAQVTRYLKEYLNASYVQIDGRPWSLGKVARHIGRGKLPVEATNPFVLWLLCHYLVEQGTWPASRVELLRFHSERNYERKDQDRDDDEPPFPPRALAFGEWARFAYLITERNWGPAIVFEMLLEGADTETVREALRVGKRCGVLEESWDRGAEHLVRFAHQRFQEFFAASYIRDKRPVMEWLGKLDAPRWQETMLNLILMGQAADVVTVLGEAIRHQLSECADALERAKEGALERAKQAAVETTPSAAPPGSEADPGVPEPAPAATTATSPPSPPSPCPEAAETAETTETSPGVGNAKASDPPAGEPAVEEPALPDEMETVLADRIELSSRIMHHAGTAAPGVYQALREPFREGVTLLANHGTPITQVKMLRACQNVPESMLEALEKPLGSGITWVRDQALILIASGRAGGAGIGSDFATEVGFDLANGVLPTRLRVYGRAAREAGRSGTWWAVLAGVCCYAANVTVLTALATAVFRWMPRLAMEFDKGLDGTFLERPQGWAVGGGLMVLVTGATVRLAPRRLWFAILATPVALGVLVPIAAGLWGGSWENLYLLMALVLAGLAVFGLGTLVAAPLHFSAIALYLAATWRLRKSNRRPAVFFASAWQSCGFDAGVRVLLWAVRIACALAVVWILGVLTWPWLGGAEDDTPLTVGFMALFLAALSTGVGAAAVHLVRRRWVPVARARGPLAVLTVIADLLRGIGIAAAIIAVFVGIAFVTDASDWFGAKVNSGIGLTIDTGITTLAVTVAGVICGVLAYLLATRGWARTGTVVRTVGRATLGPLLVMAALMALPVLAGLVFAVFGTGLARGAAVVMWLGVAGLLLRILHPVLSRIVRWAPARRRKYPHGSFTSDAWRARMQALDAAGQHDLLQRTDHHSLSLTVAGFLDVLKEVRPVIKAEPAQSTYWAQRSQLEEILRQDRQG